MTTLSFSSAPHAAVSTIWDDVEALCERAMFVQAHALGTKLGPIETWAGARAKVLAARLAANLGAPNLSRRLALAAFRRAPRDPEAIYATTFDVLETRGPLGLWQRLERLDLPSDTPPKWRARLMLQQARAATMLRDFDAAEKLIVQAEQELARNAATLVERSFVLETQDRYSEALEMAQEALRLVPLDRHALHQTATLLSLLDRNDEAITLLSRAEPQLESSTIAMHLSVLLHDGRQYDEERKMLDRVAALSPLMEEAFADMLACRRSDCAYLLGDDTRAIAEAKKSRLPLYQIVAERLESRKQGKRVMLEVAFVRQHYQTCAPATLSAISRYWKKDAPHLEIVDAICYDGTPAHSQRRWANENGWTAREFTVTWESAKELLDRNVPFTLATVDPASGHLQAVVGYDERRQSLYIRDPYITTILEVDAQRLFEQQRASGPRGLAMVPRGDSRLDDLALPDERLYDLSHELDGALSEHDRDRAASTLDALENAATGHRLAILGACALAAYDADVARLRKGADALLEAFPGDTFAERLIIQTMGDTAGQVERRERLEALCNRRPAHPWFMVRLAAELTVDAREHRRALRLLRLVTRQMKDQAEPLLQLASIEWNRHKFDEALQLWRFAACAEWKNEVAALAYFNAARALGRAAEALTWLEKRNEELGGRASGPAQTLCHALASLKRIPEALSVLDQALTRRSDDSDLLLFAVDAYSLHGKFERAAECLMAAELRTKRAMWLRTKALLTERQEGIAEALPLWQEALALEPFAKDVQIDVATRLRVTKGYDAAMAHLDRMCEQYPHHHALHELRATWSMAQSPTRHEAAIRAFLALEPSNATARRLLAQVLSAQRRFDEAKQEAARAAELDPNSFELSALWSRMAYDEGELAKYRQCLRETISRNADHVSAIHELTDTAKNEKQLREDLQFVEEEVFDKSRNGGGIGAWVEVACRVVPRQELLDKLDIMAGRRPDWPVLWILRASLLADLFKFDKALALAKEATTLFPFSYAVWLELAAMHALQHDDAADIAACAEAVACAPTSAQPVAVLADIHLRAGKNKEAKELLEPAIKRFPLEPQLLSKLGVALWNLGEREEALKHLEQSVLVAYDQFATLRLLHNCYQVVGRPEAGFGFMRKIVDSRPWDAAAHLMLSLLQQDAGRYTQALETVKAALEIDPQYVLAHEHRATLLGQLKRRKQALAACNPKELAWLNPRPLRIRAALLKAQLGDVDEGIAELQELVDERPDQYAVWTTIAEICLNDEGDPNDFEEVVERKETCKKAARKMTQLVPRNPAGWDYLGMARSRDKDFSGAAKAFRKALRLDPDNVERLSRLVSVQSIAKDFDDAEKTIDEFAKHNRTGWADVIRIDVAFHRTGPKEAKRHFRTLCRNVETSPEILVAAANTFLRHHRYDLQAVLEDLIKEEHIHPEVGALWVKVMGLRGYRPRRSELSKLFRERGELGRRAVLAAFQLLGEGQEGFGVLLLMAHLFWFRKCQPDLEIWAAAGGALVESRWYLLAAAWLSKEPFHSQAKPWMLLELVNALLARGRTMYALAVSLEAMNKPADSSIPVHRIWIAFEHACRGEKNAAADLVKELHPESTHEFYRPILHLVVGMLEVQKAPADRRRATYRAAREHFDAAFKSPPVSWISAHAGHYWRAARRVARDTRHPMALLWAYGPRFTVAWALLLLVVFLGDPWGTASFIVYGVIGVYFLLRGLERLVARV